MTRFFCLALVICTFVACSYGDDMPKNVMAPDSMKIIMFDVVRAQEYAAQKYGRDTTAINTNLPVLLQQVFAIHKISRGDFFTSFDYYEAHPDRDKELFDSLASYTDQKRQDFYKKLR